MKTNAFLLLLAGLLAAQAQTNQPADPNAPAPDVIATTNLEPSPVAAPETPASPPAAPASEISLISFADTKLTVAIENLARRAGINYMLDPKIGYDLPDANGQIKPEPLLSIRWENISAEKALLAMLDNYSLQLIRSRDTGIDRIAMKDPAAPPQYFPSEWRAAARV